MPGLKIGICGGGVGGMAAAIALQAQGHDVSMFEQAGKLGRVGADVNLTPNAVHALDRLGVGEALRANAARPTHRISRMWDTGEETSRLPMSTAAEERYGAPQLTIHRADLLDALERRLAPGTMRFGA
ncbi:MAG: NAD(P)-binding protein, partial [Rhizobiaceae bacterium]